MKPIALSSKSRAIDRRKLVTIAVLALAFAFMVARDKGWTALSMNPLQWLKPKPPATPDDTIYQMLDAARRGNTKAYLDCFSGGLRSQLIQSVKETSEARFSKYLISQNTAFTGVAVSTLSRADPEEAWLRVEYVYRDRSEVQRVLLHAESGVWKIYRVESADQIKTLIPYGTVVTD